MRPVLDKGIQAHIQLAVRAPAGLEDLHYEVSQYTAVFEAVSFGLEALATSVPGALLPPAPLTQAERAARVGIPLEVLMKRHHAGQEMLLGVIRSEIAKSKHAEPGAAVEIMLALQARGNRLTEAVLDAYRREAVRTPSSPDERRARLVQQLLSGASQDTAKLDYPFDRVWHTCVIAAGSAGAQAVETIATALKPARLVVPQGKALVRAWFGGSVPVETGAIEKIVLAMAPGSLTLALSEPAKDLDGFRLAHRQAQAALRVALVEQRLVARWVDVALLTHWVADPPLAAAFVDACLGPLNALRNKGAQARETLRALFEAGGQAANAAAKLGVHRHTVDRHVKAIEEQLGYLPFDRHAELGLALRLEALFATSAPDMDALAKRLDLVEPMTPADMVNRS
jgi:hypothetical protein